MYLFTEMCIMHAFLNDTNINVLRSYYQIRVAQVCMRRSTLLEVKQQISTYFFGLQAFLCG